jgi:hypothetical protein
VCVVAISPLFNFCRKGKYHLWSSRRYLPIERKNVKASKKKNVFFFSKGELPGGIVRETGKEPRKIQNFIGDSVVN